MAWTNKLVFEPGKPGVIFVDKTRSLPNRGVP
jgi:hypothetical protein